MAGAQLQVAGVWLNKGLTMLPLLHAFPKERLHGSNSGLTRVAAAKGGGDDVAVTDMGADERLPAPRESGPKATTGAMTGRGVRQGGWPAGGWLACSGELPERTEATSSMSCMKASKFSLRR